MMILNFPFFFPAKNNKAAETKVFEIPTALLDRENKYKGHFSHNSFVVFSNYVCRQQYIQHWITAKTFLSQKAKNSYILWNVCGKNYGWQKTIFYLGHIFRDMNHRNQINMVSISICLHYFGNVVNINKSYRKTRSHLLSIRVIKKKDSRLCLYWIKLDIS